MGLAGSVVFELHPITVTNLHQFESFSVGLASIFYCAGTKVTSSESLIATALTEALSAGQDMDWDRIHHALRLSRQMLGYCVR